MEERNYYDRLCDTISSLRKKANMTQEQLAAQLGISPQAVSKWESKHSCPDIGLLPQIAGIFDVTIDSLFGLPKKTVEIPDQPPIGIVQNLPWPDNGDFHVVVYQGHRLRRFFIGNERQNMMFRYNGPVQNVHCAVNLTCEKDIGGSATAGKDVTILGDVKAGSVTAGKDAVIHGGVGGHVHAGKDCQVGQNVGGKIGAGKNVNVKGSVQKGVRAGGKVVFEQVSDQMQTAPVPPESGSAEKG